MADDAPNGVATKNIRFSLEVDVANRSIDWRSAHAAAQTDSGG
ncbi:hypothetical protein [Mycobacterium talmoniae]|nr:MULTISPECIES: hypothetical protein [Mycobacterium]